MAHNRRAHYKTLVHPGRARDEVQLRGADVMRCPSCKGSSFVLSTADTSTAGRHASDLSKERRAENAVYRRRECYDCGNRWNTVERVAEKDSRIS